MIGILGDIPFSVSFNGSEAEILNFDTLSRSGEANYDTHKRRGLKSTLEFTGVEAENINLGISLRSDLGVNPKELLKKIIEYKDNGEVLSFVLGEELVGSGDYVIISYDAGYEYITNNGKVKKIDVNLSLKEYTEEIESNIEIVKQEKTNTTKQIIHEDFNQGAIER